MSILKANRFSFQVKFIISDVPYQLKISSDTVGDEEMILERQVITIIEWERGANMIRTEGLSGNSEFRLTGQGFMDNHGEEDLRNFATMWVMVVQEGLLMGTGEMEGTQVLPDGGIAVDPLQFLGAQQFSEILKNFFDF